MGQDSVGKGRGKGWLFPASMCCSVPHARQGVWMQISMLFLGCWSQARVVLFLGLGTQGGIGREGCFPWLCDHKSHPRRGLGFTVTIFNSFYPRKSPQY